MLRLVLASSSPRRAELLRGLGVPFEIVPIRVPEVKGRGWSPEEIARYNAVLKASVVSHTRRRSLVIGADTVISLGGKTLGKPASLREAASMLRALSGRTHEVLTAVCFSRTPWPDETLWLERTRVTFRRLSEKRISDYLKRVHVLDKAGAYAIQEHGDELVAAIRGSFTNVVGLPMEYVKKELARIPGLLVNRRPARTQRKASKT